MNKLSNDYDVLTDQPSDDSKEEGKKTQNSLYENFNNEIHENMSNTELVHFIIKNSFFGIWCKLVVTMLESLTISKLRFNESFDEFYVYFSAALIQNIGFKCIGFGLVNAAVVLSSQYFGKKDFYSIGCVFNKARFLTIIFVFLCLIFSIFGKVFISLLLGDKYLDEIQSYLLKNMIYIFFFLFQSIQALYLNSQNQYMIPAIVDTLALITQYFLFYIAYLFFNQSSFQNTDNLNLIAWVLNISSFLHYSYYTLYIWIKNPSPETNFLPNKDTFKGLSQYLIFSSQFIFYFLTHFLGNEILVLILNRKYQFNKEKEYLFDIFKIVQNYYFLIQKFPMGLGFVTMTLIGNFLMKKYFNLIRRYIKIMLILTTLISIIVIVFSLIFSNLLADFYLKKGQENYKEKVSLHIKIILPIFVTFFFENIFQGILIALGRQKIVTVLGISIIIFGGLVSGLIFIFGLNVELTGLFMIMFFLEAILLVSLIIVFLIHKTDVNYEHVSNTLSQ